MCHNASLNQLISHSLPATEKVLDYAGRITDQSDLLSDVVPVAMDGRDHARILSDRNTVYTRLAEANSRAQVIRALMEASAIGPLHRQKITDLLSRVPPTPLTEYVQHMIGREDCTAPLPATFNGYKILILRHVIYHVSPYALAKTMADSRIETCYATMHYLPEILLSDYSVDGLTNHFVKRVGRQIEAGFEGDLSNHYSTPLDVYLAWIQVPAGFSVGSNHFNVEMIQKHGSLVTFKIQRVARKVDHPARPLFVGKEYLLVGTSSTITNFATFATVLIDDADLKRPISTVRTLMIPPDIREVQAIVNSIQHRLYVNKTLISSGPLSDLKVMQQEVLNAFVHNAYQVNPVACWACRVATGRPFWAPFATAAVPFLLRESLLRRTDPTATTTIVSPLAYSIMTRMLESFGSLETLPPNTTTTLFRWESNLTRFRAHYVTAGHTLVRYCSRIFRQREWLALPICTLICGSLYYVGRYLNRSAYVTSYYRGRRPSLTRYFWYTLPLGSFAYCLVLSDRIYAASALLSLAIAKIVVTKAVNLYMRRGTDHDNEHDQQLFETLCQKFPGPGMEPVLLRTANVVSRHLSYCEEPVPREVIHEDDPNCEVLTRGVDALNFPDPLPYLPPEPEPDQRVDFGQLINGLAVNGVGVNFYDLTQGLRRNVALKAGIHNDKVAFWCFILNASLHEKPDAKIVMYCCLGSNLTNIGRLSSLVPNAPVVVVLETAPTSTLSGSPNWFVLSRSEFAARMIGAATEDLWLVATRYEFSIAQRFTNLALLTNDGDRVPYSPLKLDSRSTLKLSLPSDEQYTGCWDCANIVLFGHNEYFTELCNITHKISPANSPNGVVNHRGEYVLSMRARLASMTKYLKVRDDLYGAWSPDLRACANTYPQLFLPQIIFFDIKTAGCYDSVADYLLREAGFIHSVASQLIEQVELYKNKIGNREEAPFTRASHSLDSEFYVYQNKLYHVSEVHEMIRYRRARKSDFYTNDELNYLYAAHILDCNSWRDMQLQFRLKKVVHIDGPAGCGKTTKIRKLVQKIGVKNCVVVTQSRAGADELNKGAENIARTIGSYLQNVVQVRLRTDVVIIDEAVMMHPGQILLLAAITGARTIIMFGDNEQIKYIPRDSAYTAEMPTNPMPITRVETSHTFRCPLDATQAAAAVY